MKTLFLLLFSGFIFSYFPTYSPLESHPASIKECGNICEYLPYYQNIWGFSTGGRKAGFDELAKGMNLERELSCEYKLLDSKKEVEITLNNLFPKTSTVKTKVETANRYRSFSRTGKIIATLYVSSEGAYMGHSIAKSIALPQFDSLATVFPFYMFNFEPAVSNNHNVVDSVRISLQVAMNEEMFVAEGEKDE